MSGRRDTGFVGQLSSIKAPSSSIKFRTIDERGNSALDKVAVPTSFGGKFHGGLSGSPTPKPKTSSSRRDTGFPGQGTGIPCYKTALGIPQKESRGNGVQNQEAGSSVIGTAEKTVAADAPRGKRRDTGMVFQPRNVSYFGGKKKTKVHGSETPSQHVASSEARANALPVIGENVQRFRMSEFAKKVQTSRKSPYASDNKIKLSEKIKTVAGKARASMFSASRRVVGRISMLISSENDSQRMPGRMTAVDDVQLEEYTMEEIRKHNTDESVWIVLHGRVYDVTKWMWYHPGREEVLQQNAGEDATFKFESNYHSNYARDTARKYVIGKVKDAELGDLHYLVPEKPSNKGFLKNLSGRETILVVILAIVILRAIISSRYE